MTENDIKRILIEELENLGLIIDESDSDIAVLSQGIDSVIFISFIVAIENRFQIQFPDERLSMEIVSSLNGLATLVQDLIEKQM